MTLVRTHYIIDMVTGLIFSHYLYIICEKIAFVIDVKIVRMKNINR